MKALRHRLDLDQVEMAAVLGITREWLSKLERGRAEVSELIQRKIAEEEASANVKPLHVEEPSATFRKSGDYGSPQEHGRRAGLGTMVETRFKPRAEPTAKMCLEHFQSYLARAVAESGGTGYTWRLLQKHFPLDEFDQDETHNPNPP